MQHDSQDYILSQCIQKKTQKRHLSRQLIQHILTLYQSIIQVPLFLSQKIQHGIGLLWEEYFSQELFNIAKQRVENDMINNLAELNDWFQKISTNIKQKVNNLSHNLISHFDQIIQEEIDILNGPGSGILQFTKQEELQDIQVDKNQEIFQQNKLNGSLYETCTESSRGKKRKPTNQRLQTVSSQSICSEDLSQQFSEDKNKQTDIFSRNVNQIQDQQRSNQLLSHEHKYNRQSPNRLRKISENDSDEHDDYVEGGFYGVLLGLLEAFEM